jgi:hypothetical protein
MRPDSADLAKKLHEQGILSKEGKEKALAIRRKLYKKALEKQASGVFDWVLDRGRALASNFSQPSLRVAKTPVHPPGSVISKVDPKTGVITHIPIGGQRIEGAEKLPISWEDMVGNIAKMTILGAGIGSAQMGVSKAINRISNNRDEAILKQDLATSFGQMFEEQPALKTSDPDRVRRHFDVLAKYAPSLAKDPTIAGNWVKQTVDMRFIDADAIGRLATTEKVIREGSSARDLVNEYALGVHAQNIARAGTGQWGKAE